MSNTALAVQAKLNAVKGKCGCTNNCPPPKKPKGELVFSTTGRHGYVSPNNYT